MIAGILEFVLGNFTLTFFVVGLVAAGLRILRAPRPRRRATVTGALLDEFILWSIVVSFAYNFVLHSAFGEFTARIIGWAQSPFQLEVAFASLGFALAGLVAYPRAAGLRAKTAAVLGITAFLWGAAGGHVYQIVTTGNQAPGNSGVILYTDILLPAFGLVMLVLHRRALAEAGRADELRVVGPTSATARG